MKSNIESGPVVVQITSGKGPAECAWVVVQLVRFMAEEAKTKQLEWTQVKSEPGVETGTFVSITCTVKGKGASDWISNWCGSVQWIGQSPFRPMHRRKNWFVGVSQHSLDASYSWREADVYWQTLRASGPGGQHVNKTETAVRATHRPTGISVLASDTRSQQQNRKLAQERLRQMLKNREQESAAEEVTERWLHHHQLERGNPVRRFSGPKFKPIKN